MSEILKRAKSVLAEKYVPDADRVAHIWDILGSPVKARETVIVTRHPGAVEWLRRRGITGEVLAHVTADDVRGKRVIGALPLHLAALTAAVGSIDLPGLAAADRGRDLTPEEMDAAGASIQWYVVEALPPEMAAGSH